MAPLVSIVALGLASCLGSGRPPAALTEASGEILAEWHSALDQPCRRIRQTGTAVPVLQCLEDGTWQTMRDLGARPAFPRRHFADGAP